MLRKLSMLAVAVGLILSGCGPKNTVPIYKPEKEYKAIVSLSPGITEIAYLQLGANRLKGRTKNCNYPTGIEKVPVVMSGIKPDLEALAKVNPDLILYDPIIFSEADVAKLKELNIELFAVKAGSVDEYKRSLSELGAKLHVETNVWEYIDKIDAAIAAAKADAGPNPPRVAVLMPGEGTEHYIAGVKSYQADLIRCSGAEAVGPDENRMVPLNAESLVALNPDIIVVAGNVDSVLADPRLKTIKAIQNKRVIGVKQDLILRAGSRVDTLIQNLSKELKS